MNRPAWKPCTKSFAKRYGCISLTAKGLFGLEIQYQMSGRNGDVWHSGGDMYKYSVVLPTGQEKIFTCNVKDLGRVVRRLEVPSTPEEQAAIANSR